jgi:hypothetical protein
MIRHNFNAKYVPLDAVEFIKKKVTGTMFNNDEFGDYIIILGMAKV